MFAETTLRGRGGERVMAFFLRGVGYGGMLPNTKVCRFCRAGLNLKCRSVSGSAMIIGLGTLCLGCARQVLPRVRQGGDDRPEISRLQAGTADQCAINIWQRKNLCRV